MKDITTYRDLEAWKSSMDLCQMVYQLTELFPPKEQYGLVSQIRRATVSIPSNIAEGQGRKGSKEFLHHLSIAKGSLCEMETQLILSVRLSFLPKEDGERLWEKAQEAGRLINGLIRSLRQ